MVFKNKLNQPIIIGILGPTAVGKSQFSYTLAHELQTDIISADSMQIYKGFDIGTAKPTIDEQQIVKHHLIDIVEPNDFFSSMDYSLCFDKTYEKLNDENKNILMVGGTGFYFDTVVKKLDFDNSVDESLRNELSAYLANNGKDALHDLLKEIDIESATEIHPNNTKRVMRAIEIYRTTGIKKSQGKMTKQEYRYPFILFELTRERQNLYERINMRVDEMVKNGLVDEVSNLLKTTNPTAQSMQGIGYKEIVKYINNETTLYEAIENIKQNSRNYAKRQITYFKRLNTIKLDALKSVTENIEIVKKETKLHLN